MSLFLVQLRQALGVSPHTQPTDDILNFIYQDQRLKLAYERLVNGKSKDRLYKMLLNLTPSKELLKCLINKYYPLTKLRVKDIKKILLDTSFWVSDDSLNLIEDHTEQLPIVDYQCFIVCGCPTSTDIDVAIVVDTRDHLHDTYLINNDRLHSELSELGYDLSRDVDITRVFVQNVPYFDRSVNRQIVESSRGSSGEVNNIIYYTYQFHLQKYSLPIDSAIELDISEKIRGVAKYVLDNMKNIFTIEFYKQERHRRRKAYEGTWRRVDYSNELLLKISPDKISSDLLKSFTMKMIQVIILEKGEYCYNKIDLSKKVANQRQNGSLYFLTRGIHGNYDEDCFSYLVNEYIDVCKRQRPQKIEWLSSDLNLVKNPTTLSNELFAEFIHSPLEPSDFFIKEFEKICPHRSLNQIFRLPSRNIDKLPLDIQERCYSCDQRSDEWVELLSKYQCGQNRGVIPYDGDDWVKFYYHLIRGCIAELLVLYNTDFSSMFGDYIMINVGLLTERKRNENSHNKQRGVAPDLIIKVGDTFLPVEIKCLVGQPLTDNTTYRDELSLAKKQLRLAWQLLYPSLDKSISDNLHSKDGIIIFCYINDTNLSWSVHSCILSL